MLRYGWRLAFAGVALVICEGTAAQQTQPATQPQAEFLSAMHEGHARFSRWEFGGAAEVFRKALEADPQSLPARVNLGLALLRDTRAAEAVEVLAPAVAREQVSVQVQYLYGLALLKAGRAKDAVEPLKRVSEQAPTEVSALFMYGVALQEAGQAEAAAEVYRRVIAEDRFHLTAHYRLGMMERNAGHAEEAERMLLRFEKNHQLLGNETAEREVRGLNKFTKPMQPPSDWQPSITDPEMRFTDVTKAWELPFCNHTEPKLPFAVIDCDRDFQPELLGYCSKLGWTFSTFKNNRLETVSLNSTLPSPVGWLGMRRGVAVGDYDNDGLEDACWVYTSGAILVKQSTVRVFKEVTEAAGLKEVRGADAAWVDTDHDGDLDLVVVRHSFGADEELNLGKPGLSLFRNRGDGTFADDTVALKLPCLFGEDIEKVYRVAAAEMNGDDLTDLLLASERGCAILFNAGFDDFDSPKLPPWSLTGTFINLAVNDLNNDGHLDAAFLQQGVDGENKLIWGSAGLEPIEAQWATNYLALLDFDADGFLDVSGMDLNVWLSRNRGNDGWGESRRTGCDGLTAYSENSDRRSNSADFDGDGDVDLLLHGGWWPVLARNDTAKPGNILRLSLQGTKSNRSAIGSRVELRAGAKRIFRNVDSPTTLIGVGDITRLDSVTVYWTNGATDAVTNVDVSKPLVMVEPQATLGSCPYLYVWDGQTFRFVTDILGGSPLGLSAGGGRFVPADTDEIVALEPPNSFGGPIDATAPSAVDQPRTEGVQGSPMTLGFRVQEEKSDEATPLLDKEGLGEVRERTGAGMAKDMPVPAVSSHSDPPESPLSKGGLERRVVVEITDELREILYLDRVKLLVADHPPGTEVHPTDKLMMPPFPKSELWTVTELRPPTSMELRGAKSAPSPLALEGRQLVAGGVSPRIGDPGAFSPSGATQRTAVGASAEDSAAPPGLGRSRPDYRGLTPPATDLRPTGAENERARSSREQPNQNASDGVQHSLSGVLHSIDGLRTGPTRLRDSHWRGLVEPHALELLFDDLELNANYVLVCTGWLQYGDASVNVAASQNPTLGNPFPILSVHEGPTILEQINTGAPAGKTKTILVDLAGRLPPKSDSIRLEFTSGLEIYWDRIALGKRAPDPVVTEIDPDSAVLRYRGVSRMVKPARDEPAVPVYDDLLEHPPWRLIPEGYHTRYGDVLPLITSTDDHYVILACGDAVRIEFEIENLPPPPEGGSRDYFLYTDGWDKDMDANVLHGDMVEPLPFHGLDDQRYGQEPYPGDRDWLDEWNTRWVPGDLNAELGTGNEVP